MSRVLAIALALVACNDPSSERRGFSGPTPSPTVLDPISLRSAGAFGDGATDDTAAFQTAINTDRNVICRGGDTYLVNGGITSTAVGQVIDMTGCVVKLKNSAGSQAVLTISGVAARVRGGEWNMNASNNPSGGYGAWAVKATGDKETVENIYVHDSSGLCIAGLAVNLFTVRANRMETCATMAVYIDTSGSADTNDIVVDGNTVSFTSANTGTQGIGLYSGNGHTMRRLKVLNNSVLGPLASSDGTTVAITVRGAESVVANNIVRGTTIGISVDQSVPQDCSITGNNIAGANGGSIAYGIEINGGFCTVANNYVQDGNYGIVGSVPSGAGGRSLDHLVVSGNVLIGQAVKPIYFLATSTFTGRYLEITGNTIQPGAGSYAVYLAGDFKYTLIHGNVFHGPGGSVNSSRGVFLDGVNSDVRITGNRFIGWQRAATIYNGAAVAQDRIVFENNDLFDIGSLGSSLLNLEVSATLGASIRIRGNYTGSTATLVDDYLDVANNIRSITQNIDTPEGAATAGVGSTFVSTTTGLTFSKFSGSGNTGWIPAGITGGVTNALSKFGSTSTVVPSGIIDDGTTALIERSLIAALGYPTTTATAAGAVGYGTWSSGWLFDEASGNLVPVFGSPTLTTNGGTRTYGIAGALGGGDKAIGFGDTAASWDGGANFDVTGTDDLIVAWVGKWNSLPTGLGTIFSKEAAAAASGWAITPTSDGSALRLCLRANCTVVADVTGAYNVGSWHVGIAVIDRSTNRARIGMCPFGGAASVSTQTTLTASESFTTAATFRLGSSAWQAADTHMSIAALYVAKGSGVATGLSANLSTALVSLQAAIQATTTLGTTTVNGTATTNRVQIGGATGPVWSSGTGVPAINCSVGDLFSRTDGGATTSLYVCTASNTWTNK